MLFDQWVDQTFSVHDGEETVGRVHLTGFRCWRASTRRGTRIGDYETPILARQAVLDAWNRRFRQDRDGAEA